jgi:CheY-like chemotaxis protein
MHRKILLVEDNLDDEALTRRALSKSGFDHELVVVRDGKEALDYLFREGPYAGLSAKNLPDLIFLDLKLPLLGGLEVLERLRDNVETRVIPVVVLTSSKQDDDVLKSYNLGANSYIRKRVDALAFQEALKDTLSYWFDFIKLPTRN